MNIERNNILNDDTNKKPIVFDTFYTPSGMPKPIVIFCHGYKGFKDWGAWNLVAEAFANAGFFFLKFNFSHNGGTVKRPVDFPDLEAFAKNNFTLELDDLQRIIDMITTTKKYAPEADGTNISLIGHSRGGGIVIIKAEEDPRIKKVISWAGVSDFKSRFKEGSDSFEAWKKTGVTHVENGRTKQQMPHYFQFYKNFKENEERLTIHRAVRELTIPYLIIHGNEDPTVSIEEAKQLHTWNNVSVLKVIPNADHVFGASHPWETSVLPSQLLEVIDATISFLKQY